MKDTTFAWSCAANLLLYDADPARARSTSAAGASSASSTGTKRS